ncbi:MAG: glycosyltransferase family 2 protein [Candidatus Gracilibacteria bacterium]
MNQFFQIISYIFLFFVFYFEIFILLSFLERKKTPESKEMIEDMPVTILIPCFNEETTIVGTLESIFELNYDQEKLQIIIINDGSTDKTAELLKPYASHHNIQIIHKENGGKHTALNLGLEYCTTSFVGCLDADSFVVPDALRQIMHKFADPKVMAVTPSTVIWEAKTLIQKMQRAEYHYGNLIRYAMSLMHAIHIAPGPFSFFRKEVFEMLGNYKHAHNTEDMEIAMRMQKNNLKIVHSPRAVVYTSSPSTIKKLYKQRVRWVGGFLGNLIDYKNMLFNKKHGDLGIIVLPMALISILLTIPFVLASVYRMIISIQSTINDYWIYGLKHWKWENFDIFFVNMNTMGLLTSVLLLILIFLLACGKRITSGKWEISGDFIFLMLYTFIAPFWLGKALYNNVQKKQANWR